jgi:hypothetical protein
MKYDQAEKNVDERRSAAGKREHLDTGGFEVLTKLDPGAGEINSKSIVRLGLCSGVQFSAQIVNPVAIQNDSDSWSLQRNLN